MEKEPGFTQIETRKIHKGLLEEVFAVTRKRGKVWLYPFLKSDDSIAIGVWGEEGGTFLFEAVPKKFLSPNDTEEPDQMVLPSDEPKLSEVKRKLRGFLKRQYEELDGLPILFITNTQILRSGRWRRGEEIKFQVIA